MNILLADDQPRVRSAIRLLLEQQSTANIVEEVSSAEELLDYLAYACPDALLLDWMLPGSTPEKLLTTLRNIYPDLSIIVLDSMPQTEKTAFKNGASDFVSKNDPPECLLVAINRYKHSASNEDNKEIR